MKLMNDSKYGLTASIWTSDEAAFESLVDKIEAGTVFQNRCDYLDPALAWTGFKQSGRGVSLSKFGEWNKQWGLPSSNHYCPQGSTKSPVPKVFILRLRRSLNVNKSYRCERITGFDCTLLYIGEH